MSRLIMKGVLGLTDAEWWVAFTEAMLGLAFIVGVFAPRRFTSLINVAIGVVVGAFGCFVLDRDGGPGAVLFGLIVSPLLAVICGRMGAWIALLVGRERR